MRISFTLIVAFIFIAGSFINPANAITDDTLLVKKTADFTVSGKGDNEAWTKTSWQKFVRVDSGGRNYESRSKMLYSENGIYILFEGEDDLVTTKNYNDDEEIYEGDVFEFFLQTGKGKAYFEYEINHLGKQLVLTLSGTPHKNLAWSPWGHEYKKRPFIKSKVSIYKKNGEVTADIKPGEAISSWKAEIFLPYEIISLLPNAVPTKGTVWRGNPCRIDYDSGKMIQWSWSKKIKKDFHELENFGIIVFE